MIGASQKRLYIYFGVALAIGNAKVEAGDAPGLPDGAGVAEGVGLGVGVGVGNGGMMFSQ